MELTVALVALVDDPVEEGAAVVAERGAGVGVHLELVPRPAVLKSGEKGGSEATINGK